MLAPQPSAPQPPYDLGHAGENVSGSRLVVTQEMSALFGRVKTNRTKTASMLSGVIPGVYCGRQYICDVT